ncbi:MAG: sensor histidine kinase [Pseudobdellovibrio sp.]
MLYQFLEKHETEVLALAEEKSLKLAGPLLSSRELKMALPIFYKNLIEYLKFTNENATSENIIRGASEHAKELLRLNYTLSHVVHSYGAMCQAVTEFAQRKNAPITTKEFNDLNMCLDIAIASAVSEFQFLTVKAIEDREVQHLGILVHELRNALSRAMMAHEMIKQGLVGSGGSTSRVLGENLLTMRNLIDRSLSDVRMRADPELYIEHFKLSTLVDQIVVTAQDEVKKKNQTITADINQQIELDTDRQLLLSAIANLIQNSLKYSKNGGRIVVRAAMAAANVIIEVEDECGGIPPEMLKKLFKPFSSGGLDQSGLGLGLTIIQRAVSLLQGKIANHNMPGKGCAFRIEIPAKLVPKSDNRPFSGEDSSQPKHTKLE